MGKNKYRFKGHESFILREGWLNKGLYEVDRIPMEKSAISKVEKAGEN